MTHQCLQSDQDKGNWMLTFQTFFPKNVFTLEWQTALSEYACVYEGEGENGK